MNKLFRILGAILLMMTFCSCSSEEPKVKKCYISLSDDAATLIRDGEVRLQLRKFASSGEKVKGQLYFQKALSVGVIVPLPGNMLFTSLQEKNNSEDEVWVTSIEKIDGESLYGYALLKDLKEIKCSSKQDNEKINSASSQNQKEQPTLTKEQKIKNQFSSSGHHTKISSACLTNVQNYRPIETSYVESDSDYFIVTHILAGGPIDHSNHSQVVYECKFKCSVDNGFEELISKKQIGFYIGDTFIRLPNN